MAKLNTKDKYHLNEAEFVDALGPALESIEGNLSNTLTYIEKTYPGATEDTTLLTGRTIAVPLLWFVWLAGAAGFVTERYRLQKEPTDGQPN